MYNKGNSKLGVITVGTEEGDLSSQKTKKGDLNNYQEAINHLVLSSCYFKLVCERNLTQKLQFLVVVLPYSTKNGKKGLKLHFLFYIGYLGQSQEGVFMPCKYLFSRIYAAYKFSCMFFTQPQQYHMSVEPLKSKLQQDLRLLTTAIVDDKTWLQLYEVGFQLCYYQYQCYKLVA
eukprot:TRINITY_DN3834_c1_g1_i2.p1 TRINITY_DN3834_c1_g1~~TRINITY_DN3834_c1_g1_i2.p1  ORF type:complete len:175 (-),score=3.67 TRINITY_DN3834_c1_g1_i2:409-933(-)